jgi:hypothetical protein
MSNQWVDVLSPAELEASYRLTASLDPSFAQEQRRFYESRSIDQLKALVWQSWSSNDSDGYQMARSYAALKGWLIRNTLAT